MKQYRFVIFSLLIMLMFNINSYCQERGFGMGVIIGEPTGISMKGWLSSKSAMDAGIAWSFYREPSIHIHADYLLHEFNTFTTSERVPLYYGIGGRIKIRKNEDAQLGLRMVFGIEYLFHHAPIDLFLEVAPILDLVPATELHGNGGLGARFYFR